MLTAAHQLRNILDSRFRICDISALVLTRSRVATAVATLIELEPTSNFVGGQKQRADATAAAEDAFASAMKDKQIARLFRPGALLVAALALNALVS